jgi:hypothetical protein
VNQPRVIDLSRPRAPDLAPEPRFRRTAQDNKHARPWRQPNDGPGCLEERQRKSDAIRAVMIKPTTSTNRDSHAARSAAFEERMLQALHNIAAGAEILNDIAEPMNVGIERVRDLLAEALRRGLVSKKPLPQQGRTFNVWALTEAGLALVGGVGQ